MNVWFYLKLSLGWSWRCVRAWLEVGRRLSRIELEMQEQTAVRKLEVDRLQKTMLALVETEKSSLEQVRLRLDDLERQQVERLSSLDRTLQSRVDEWARQLSGQMNQLYAAVARSPVEARKG